MDKIQSKRILKESFGQERAGKKRKKKEKENN